MLIVLRGNSGSGKSTVARLLQAELEGPTANLGQDHFRREVYRESDHDDMAHAELLELAAVHCLRRGDHVILEGILSTHRYGEMIERIAAHATDARFFAFDLDFDETARRHATRPLADEFSVDEMREWYHGWQPLDFVEEQRIGPDESPEHIVARILGRA
ncbi:AAA family ATPase [Agromyces sp. SYSU T00194]|uniref:AAA family ATPase n=1 Tax=Agromyces chitinivorans TaxID=3158560 RepID=UPI0033916967